MATDNPIYTDPYADPNAPKKTAGALGANPSGSMNNAAGVAPAANPGGAAGGNMNPAGGVWGDPQPAAPAAPTAAPTRTNFSWGSTGVGKAGADYGNTNNWTEQQWQDYEARSNPAVANPPKPAAPVAPAGPPVTGPVPPGTGPSPTAPAAPTAPANPNDPHAALVAQLMQRMQQGTDINANDPVIKNQTDAYSAQQERARRNMLADAAEGGSPYSTGAQDNLSRMSAESMGQDVGGFQSQLVGRELTSRRDEIQKAIEGLGSTLSNDEQLALQKELGQMNGAIERQKTDNQNSQFYSQLSQADKQFLAQLSQQGRFQEMDDAFRKMQLAQNDTQFRDNLGLQTTVAANDADIRRRGL